VVEYDCSEGLRPGLVRATTISHPDALAVSDDTSELTYLEVFAVLRLRPMRDRDKDVEILALDHQIAVLKRQLGGQRVRFTAGDRAFLAALLHRLPPQGPRQVRLQVRPDRSCAGTAIWSPAVTTPDHGPSTEADRVPYAPSGPLSYAWPGRIRTGAIAACTASCWFWGVKVAASRVWEILQEAGIPPAPERASSTWADFLRSQADTLLACDFFDTVTLYGARLYVLAVTGHANRRIRVLGATAHPTATWVTQAAKSLIWNQRHLLHALGEFEAFYNEHRPHQGIANTRPLHPLPAPTADSERIARLDIRRRDRLGGILHEYQHAT
jgi:hypothetical protein